MLAIITERPRTTNQNISGGEPTNRAFLFYVDELSKQLILRIHEKYFK